MCMLPPASFSSFFTTSPTFPLPEILCQIRSHPWPKLEGYDDHVFPQLHNVYGFIDRILFEHLCILDDSLMDLQLNHVLRLYYVSAIAVKSGANAYCMCFWKRSEQNPLIHFNFVKFLQHLFVYF